MLNYITEETNYLKKNLNRSEKLLAGTDFSLGLWHAVLAKTISSLVYILVHTRRVNYRDIPARVQ